jgi:hypothetical protein
VNDLLFRTLDVASCGKHKLQEAKGATINHLFHPVCRGAGPGCSTGLLYAHSRRVERFFTEEMRTSGDFMRKETPKPEQRATAPPSATRRGYVEGSLSQFFLKVCSLDLVRNVVEIEDDCQRRATPAGLRQDRNKRKSNHA